MEIIYILIIVLFIGIIISLLWKNRCLKHDIYDFTGKLENSLNELLNSRNLNKTICEQDDLWGMVYEKLCRISDMYTHKNQELFKEKENLKELVSDISHQTKTPLANIKLYQEMLFDEVNTSESTEYLIKMSKQVDKLDFLLQNMIKMSRLETGTIKIQKSKQFIAETLALAIGAVVPKADKKNIQIHVTYDETLQLEHDKKWTAEAIFNILDNAVKYTSVNGSINIVVNKETIFTKISITDTGKGIPLERQGMIFNRFYREPDVHNTEGVGIGLYLAREIICMQKGYIEVESESGKGSTFHLYFPN
jgi:signal transduction histidine kinase